MQKKLSSLLKIIWGSEIARKALTLASILLTTGVLGYLIYSEWNVLYSLLYSIRPWVLILSFCIYSVILLFTSFVWANIMDRLGHKVAFRKHFLTFCISALGKRLPGTLWYVAWRANLYKDDGYQAKFVILTSSVEMVIIVVAAIVVSLFFSIPLILQFSYSIIAFIIVIIGSLLFLHPKINKWIFNKLNVELSKFNYKDILKWIFIYILVWLLVGSLLFTFANLFSSIEITYLSYFIGASALTGVLSRLFLFLPSHFGFGEVSLSLLLSGIMPSSLAVIVALSNRIIITFFEIVWAVLAILIKRIIDMNSPK